MDANAALLLNVVGTAVLVGGIFWALERRKERTDLTNLGKKVDGIQTEVGTVKTDQAALRQIQAEDRLATLQQQNAIESRIQQQLSSIQSTLARFDERFDVVALLKAVVHEDRK